MRVSFVAIKPEPGWHRAYLGVPYLWRGQTPAGWDCRGLIAWCRPRHYGLPAPDNCGVADPASPDTLAGRLDQQDALIRDEMGAWRRVERVPGCVVLFRIRNRLCHTGLYLGGGDFLHAMNPVGARAGQPATTVERLTDPVWANRIEGFYDRES